MALRIENYGDAVFVYSLEQESVDNDVSAVGIASLRNVDLHDGQMYIEGKFEIKPHCPLGELDEVKRILLQHISK